MPVLQSRRPGVCACPETDAVLATLGSFHPRKDVAKAARRSLFKFRSSGGSPG